MMNVLVVKGYAKMVSYKLCQHNYHRIEDDNKNKNLKWMCDECNGQYVNMVDTSVKKIMSEMMEAMEKMVTSKLTAIIKKNQNTNNNNKENLATYANTVTQQTFKERKQEVILVQPKRQVKQVKLQRRHAKKN